MVNLVPEHFHFLFSLDNDIVKSLEHSANEDLEHSDGDGLQLHGVRF